MKKRDGRNNYLFRVMKGREVVYRYESVSRRCFLREIGSVNFLNRDILVYVRVSYGRGPDVRGGVSAFFNDGEYDNFEDLMYMVKAFWELGVID